MKDSGYSFLWSDNEPSLRTIDQQSRLLVDAEQDLEVKSLVPIIYHHFKPPPNFVRNRYKKMFSMEKSGTDANTRVNTVNIYTEAAQKMIVVKGHRGTHDATIQNGLGGGPLPEDRSGMPLILRSYTYEPHGPLIKGFSVVRFFGHSEQHYA